MSRRRIPDSRKVGRSKLVPYRPNEDPMDRHARRLTTAEQNAAEMTIWCGKRGIKIKVTNGWHHWTFRFRVAAPTLDLSRPQMKTRIAEWWPSSAKLVFDKQWNRGIHAHDYQQVRRELANRWGLPA